MGEVFLMWRRENHTGELVSHVERAASGGRQDIASMAATAIYWNRNYCIGFLDEMITYCGKEDNILAGNLFVLVMPVVYSPSCYHHAHALAGGKNSQNETIQMGIY